jgi:hypothetical protein
MTVGFDGGSILFGLGSAEDVNAFFVCIDEVMEKAKPSVDRTILTDRLFKRYLRLEELDNASALMKQVRAVFEEVPSVKVDWAALGVSQSDSQLNIASPTLGDVFARYFEGFDQCVESAKIFHKSWNQYQPVRTVPSDLAGFTEEKERPLQEYDELDGPPFWLKRAAQAR